MSEWISAAMPPIGIGPVLCIVELKGGRLVRRFGEFHGTVYHPIRQQWDGWWKVGSVNRAHVLLWMPLPEIPEDDIMDEVRKEVKR